MHRVRVLVVLAAAAGCRYGFDPLADVPDSAVGACAVERPGPSLAMGIQHTCLVRADGTLWCAGLRYGPVFERVGTDADWARVDTSELFTCALKTDCSLWCWGDNSFGQLGLGDAAPRSAPTQVTPGTRYRDIATGRFHACAVRDDAALFCWGEAAQGALGLGVLAPDRHAPTRVGTGSWQDIDRGGVFTCGIDAATQIYCWGQNMLGELGLGDTTVGTIVPSPELVDVPGHPDMWKQVAGGKSLMCARHFDLSAWCWGENNDGESGQGHVLPQTRPGQVASTAGWTQIAAGRFHACGIRADASLWCWGDNQVFSVGVPPNTRYDTPQMIVDPPAWQSVWPMGTGSCAFATDGELYCWGENLDGQLGLGDVMNRPTPVHVTLP